MYTLYLLENLTVAPFLYSLQWIVFRSVYTLNASVDAIRRRLNDLTIINIVLVSVLWKTALLFDYLRLLT